VGGPSLCAKRALPKLKVASDWQAPVERNQYEAAYLRRVAAIVPGAVPRVLAEDRASRSMLMEYLPAEDYRLWKTEMLAGRFDPAAAPAVAAMLARIHAATWRDLAVAAEFPTDALFDALRLDPYLRTLAARKPELAEPILAVIATTASTKLALVHGDVSPKNILLSRADGLPVLLDAECAWYGDPAFDTAFCLNHLLLKAVHLPALREQLLGAAHTFLETWIAGLPKEGAVAAARRALTLLPCLLLARVDGKSPVEYFTDADKAVVRAATPPLILAPPADLPTIVAALRKALA
jgi:aminoglycoside phosphotransferase (APT) family kinase protein